MRAEVRGPMQDREARDLRRRVARLKRDRPGFRFSAALRSEITTWVAKQRERGEWCCELARAIDVPAETLKRWATPRRDAVAMLPVHELTYFDSRRLEKRLNPVNTAKYTGFTYDARGLPSTWLQSTVRAISATPHGPMTTKAGSRRRIASTPDLWPTRGHQSS
jgi:hypothetical protein